MRAPRPTASLCFVFALCILAGCTESPEQKLAKHFERGLAYWENEQYPEATIEFLNVLKIDPNHADGHHRLGLA